VREAIAVTTAYETPGVYYERADAATGIGAVRMDVAGFVGIAERGPVGRPIPIESWRQFQAWFGGPQGYAFLAYAVRGFFENGGDRCWVVRVAPDVPDLEHACAGADVPAEAGNAPPWRIEASSPGAWGNDLRVVLRRTNRVQTTARFSRREARVSESGGFERGTLIRITQAQPVGPPAVHYRVVAHVDPIAHRIEWAAQDRDAALRYDEPIAGLREDADGTVESVEYDLVVFSAGRPVAVFGRLSAVPEHPRYGPRLLEAPWEAAMVASAYRVPSAPPLVRIVELRAGFAPATGGIALRDALVPARLEAELRGGVDLRAQLTPDDFIGVEPVFGGAEAHPGTGLEAVLAVDEVSLVAVPDLHVESRPPAGRDALPPCPTDPCDPDARPAPPAPAARPAPDLPPVLQPDQVYRVQDHLVRRCEERGDAVALLEPPAEVALDSSGTIEPVLAWRSRFDSSYGALFHPWLLVLDPAPGASGEVRPIPPSGHVAGQIARAARNEGVHHSGANRPLIWTHAASIAVDHVRHGLLNSAGVNVIRSLEGRGIRVLGSRTVSNDTSFRFLPVRRLAQMIRKALALGTQWAVFEPHDRLTRDKLRLVVFSYLLALYERGMFAGDTPESSFEVRCDDSINPPDQRARGELLAEVRFAPVTPLEFVVVRVLDVGGELETVESTERGATLR
jgi:phage tail sheath protein FI